MSDIVIVIGSNNKNLEVAKVFDKKLEERGVSREVVDLVSLELPLYSSVQETKGIPEKIYENIEILDRAKGFVFVTPEYNGGLPPALTNYIAWISRSGDGDWRKCFNGKPCAMASFSGGGGFQALMALRLQLSYLGLNTIGRQVRATFKEDLNIQDVEAVSELLVKGINCG